MSEQDGAAVLVRPDALLASYFTSEYSRLGVTVKDNCGLSAPVLVNVLTGVMHADNGDGGLLCEQRMTWRKEVHGVLRSVSSVGFRACRYCEKVIKANAHLERSAVADSVH
jgi:hypothetical protein